MARSFWIGMGCLGMIVAAVAGGQSAGGAVVSVPPGEPDPGGRYVFYLHGRIIEDEGERPTHPRFGVYEYRTILAELAAAGATVISEPRPAGTVPGEYAQMVAGQVRALLAAGVPPERITVVAFSKGGVIAMLVSSLLQERDVRYVFLASCGGWVTAASDLRVSGRVLAMQERSDELAGSCQAASERSGALGELVERVIDTGEGHGAFYRPRPEWLGPVTGWILGTD